MSYSRKELQAICKELKSRGLTEVKGNAKSEDLQMVIDQFADIVATLDLSKLTEPKDVLAKEKRITKKEQKEIELKAQTDAFVEAVETQEVSLAVEEEFILVDDKYPDNLSLIDYFKDANEIVFDIETYGAFGANGLDFRRGKIRLIQLYSPDLKPLVIDCKSRPSNFDNLINDLKVLFTDETKLLKAQNGIFDLTYLRCQFGIISHTRYFDTRVASQLIYAGVKDVRHGLKDIIKRTLGEEISKYEQMSDWGLPLIPNQLSYAVKDVLYTYRVSKPLVDEIKQAKILSTVKIECSAIPVFVEMQVEGLPVDVELLDQTIAEYEAFIEKMQEPWFNATGLTYTAAPLKKLEALTALGIKGEDGKPLTDAQSATLAPFRDDPIVRSLWLATTAKMSLNYLLNIKKSLFNGHFSGGFYRPLADQALGRSSCGSDKLSTLHGVNHQNCSKYPDIREFRNANLRNIREVFSIKPISEEYALIGMDLAAA